MTDLWHDTQVICWHQLDYWDSRAMGGARPVSAHTNSIPGCRARRLAYEYCSENGNDSDQLSSQSPPRIGPGADVSGGLRWRLAELAKSSAGARTRAGSSARTGTRASSSTGARTDARARTGPGANVRTHRDGVLH